MNFLHIFFCVNLEINNIACILYLKSLSDDQIVVGAWVKNPSQYVRSNKGYPQLVYGRNIFNYERSRREFKYWLCSAKYSSACSVRMKTTLDESMIFLRHSNHTHKPPLDVLRKKSLITKDPFE